MEKIELEIVKEIPDQDFGLIELGEDNQTVEIKDHHGTIYLCKGLCDDPDECVAIGVIDGENEGHMAAWKRSDEIQKIARA